jgi:hypothetical protein
VGDELESLAARKQLLVMEAALQRLRATNELVKLREKARWVARIASWAGIALAVVRAIRR